MTSPLGDVTVHYFTNDNGFWTNGLPYSFQRVSGQYFLSKQIFAGAASSFNGARRSEWVRFTADPNNAVSIGQENQRLERSRTEYLDDNKYAEVTFAEFDGLGHYRTSTTGGNFGSGDVRTSKTDYNPTRGIFNYDANTSTYGPGHSFTMVAVASPWVLGTYGYQQWTEGATSSKTLYTFDGNTGFLASVRTLKSGTSTLASDLFTLRCPDSRGNLASESFYGGDVQSLTGLAVSCGSPGSWQYRLSHAYANGSLASSIYRRTDAADMEFYSYKATIDASTGLVATEEDPSGYVAKYTYDGLGRLTLVEPGGSSGGSEAGAKTSYTYSGGSGGTGGKVQIDVLCPTGVTCSAPSPTSFGQTILVVDGFGRLIRERVLRADGSTSRKRYFYNALGWKTGETETGPDVDGNPGTTYSDFDPFGRPGLITPADGATHQIELTYWGVRQVDRNVKIATSTSGSESSFTTTEFYDRQGRLSKVWEPSGAGGANLNTLYGYDVDGRLASVSHNTGGGPIQTRAFSYDHRGFLSSETHPEKGAGGGGAVTYLNFDARGHAGEKRDGSNSRNLLFTYDKAERLTSVTEGGAGGRALKQFVFGTSGAGRGKLQTAKRWNYFPAFGVTALVTETYGYGGPGRRTTSRSTQLNYFGANQERFDQGYTWNRDGSLQSLSYPRCFNGGRRRRDRRPDRVLRLRQWLPGERRRVRLAWVPLERNGRLDRSYQRGHRDRGERPGTDPPAGGDSSRRLWLDSIDGRLLLRWCGKRRGDQRRSLRFDGASRLVTAQMGQGGQTNTQAYAYDPFGNITGITTNGVLRSTPTSTSTNRLTSATYDEGGNLLTWNGQVYAYDRLNMPTRRTVGGEDWIFAYTADDERIWSYRTTLGGSVYTLRDLDGKVLRRHDAHLGWTTFTDSIYRDAGNLLASETSSGVRTHFHLDHLGTPRILTSSTGAITRFYSYYPYGEELFPRSTHNPSGSPGMSGTCSAPLALGMTSTTCTHGKSCRYWGECSERTSWTLPCAKRLRVGIGTPTYEETRSSSWIRMAMSLMSSLTSGLLRTISSTSEGAYIGDPVCRGHEQRRWGLISRAF